MIINIEARAGYKFYLFDLEKLTVISSITLVFQYRNAIGKEKEHSKI